MNILVVLDGLGCERVCFKTVLLVSLKYLQFGIMVYPSCTSQRLISESVFVYLES